MINMDTILIAHDDSVGIVYCPERGSVKTTTPEHAKRLQSVYNDYNDKKLSEQECSEFEQYLENTFKNKEVLPYASFPNLLELEVLERLEIMLANDCNLNCKYCYAGGGNYGKTPTRMNPEDVEKYLDALLIGKYRSVGIVMLFGGEPTIAPKTIQAICEYFNKNVLNGTFCSMPTFTMVSNGTLIDEKLVEIIKKYEIRVTISVDGPKDINDLLRVDRNGNGTFSRIEHGIRLMQSAGCPPKMIEATYTSLHKQMGYDKKKLHAYLKDHFGVERILVANCTATPDNDVLAYNDDSEIESTKDSLEIRIGLARKFFVDVSCSAGISSCALMPNGELYPCHFFVNDNAFRIATFSKDEFDYDNYPNVLSHMSPSHKCNNARCAKCWAKTLCKACPAGMILQPQDTSSCKLERSRLVNMLLQEAKRM